MSKGTLHEGFLVYKNFLFVWIVFVLVAVVLLFLIQKENLPVTITKWVFNYGLGILSLLIMLWLSWFGARKRKYADGTGGLKTWLSAHVYFGVSLLFFVPMHSGLSIELNLHGAAYFFVMLTVLTGIAGVFLYRFYPRKIAQNRAGLTFNDMINNIAELDSELRTLSPNNSENINSAVQKIITNTRIGGGIFLLFVNHKISKNKLDKIIKEEDLKNEFDRRVYFLLQKRIVNINKIQIDIQMRSRLRAWILFHVPLSLISVALVLAHAIGMLMFGFASNLS